MGCHHSGATPADGPAGTAAVPVQYQAWLSFQAVTALVAATNRTSARCSTADPSARKVWSCRNRSSATCARGVKVSSSSRNSVPRAAWVTRPCRRAWASVLAIAACGLLYGTTFRTVTIIIFGFLVAMFLIFSKVGSVMAIASTQGS